MDITLKNLNLGKIKALLDRQRSYLVWGNSFVLFYLFFKEVPFHWYYMFLILFLPIGVCIDIKYILPGERSYLDSKSKILKKINEKP